FPSNVLESTGCESGPLLHFQPLHIPSKGLLTIAGKHKALHWRLGPGCSGGQDFGWDLTLLGMSKGVTFHPKTCSQLLVNPRLSLGVFGLARVDGRTLDEYLKMLGVSKGFTSHPKTCTQLLASPRFSLGAGRKRRLSVGRREN